MDPNQKLPEPNPSSQQSQSNTSQLPPQTPTPQTQEVAKKTSKFSLKAIISTIIFLLLAGGAAAGYVYREPILKLVNNPSPTPTVSVSPSPTPDPTADPTPTSGPEGGWKTYTNSTVRYSFIYPAETYSIASCKKEDHGYRTQNGMVPVVVSESDNTIYIGKEFEYRLEGEVTNINGITYASECDKVTKTVTGERLMSHIVRAAQASSDQDLDKFIKESFDPSCSLYKKERIYNQHRSGKPLKELAYQVFIANETGETPDNGADPCNSFGPITYYPDNKLVLYASYGHDCSLFGEPQEVQACYSDAFVDSLKPF